MLEPLSIDLARRYEIQLEQTGIARPLWNHYTKWLRYYWDFCHKYAHPPNEQQSFPRFDEKLRAKHQSESQRQQARQALSLYYGLAETDLRGGERSRKERASQLSNEAATVHTQLPSKPIATIASTVRALPRTPAHERSERKLFRSGNSPQPTPLAASRPSVDSARAAPPSKSDIILLRRGKRIRRGSGTFKPLRKVRIPKTSRWRT